MKKEDAVERVLRGLGTVEAPSGLEGRVLLRLAERDSRRGTGWVWSFGLAAGMALVGVLAWNFGGLGHSGRGHTPEAKAPVEAMAERPKAEALGYLQANATTTATADSSASPRMDKQVIATPSHVSEARHGVPNFVAGMESFPSPPEPLTEQERLLVRVARHPGRSEAQFLIAEVREAELVKAGAEFDRFFPPPAKLEQPLAATPATQDVSPTEVKESNHEVQPIVR